MKKIKYVLLFGAAITLFHPAKTQTVVITDPLTSTVTVAGEINKKSHGGEFTANGWRALNDGDYLMIELDSDAGLEGSLEVDISELDWVKHNTVTGKGKMHFINMFSNPVADHHAEHGGTATDALWTLRCGKGDGEEARYGNNFKILWASKGAKRTPGSDYHEKVVRVPDGWQWDKPLYSFKVSWSQKLGKIEVSVNGSNLFEGAWANQVSPLKYVYLAKSPDFHTFVGPVFSNLRVSLGPKN